jgi:hypothetical protein
VKKNNALPRFLKLGLPMGEEVSKDSDPSFILLEDPS